MNNKKKHPKAKSGKFVLHTIYSQDNEGNWTKKVNEPQCPKDILLSGQCQGVNGHLGNHWYYRSDGSYAWAVNDKDPPENKKRNIAGGWNPPDSKDWVSPVDMIDKHYTCFYTVTPLKNKRKIASLLRGEMEEGASINQPCTEEEIAWLRENGRLDGLGEE